MAEKSCSVCVTGAGGYVASWLVKLSPLTQLHCHGAVRDPCIFLFKKYLPDTSIKGCSGVYHVACPVPPSSLSNPVARPFWIAKKRFHLLVPWPISELAGIEGYEELENQLLSIFDVRDVAESLILAYERPEAKGRNTCITHATPASDLVEILRRKYPNLNHPKRFKEAKSKNKLSSEKLQRLNGTLVDSIESYKQAGLVN